MEKVVPIGATSIILDEEQYFYFYKPGACWSHSLEDTPIDEQLQLRVEVVEGGC